MPPTAIPPAARFRLRPGVLMRELEGEAVLLDPERGAYFGLNSSGLEIARLLDGESTIGEILSALATRFAAPATELAADLDGLVAALEREGLVLRLE